MFRFSFIIHEKLVNLFANQYLIARSHEKYEPRPSWQECLDAMCCGLWFANQFFFGQSEALYHMFSCNSFVALRHHFVRRCCVYTWKHGRKTDKIIFRRTFSMREGVCGDLTARYHSQILTAIIRIIFWYIWNDFDAGILTKWGGNVEVTWPQQVNTSICRAVKIHRE